MSSFTTVRPKGRIRVSTLMVFTMKSADLFNSTFPGKICTIIGYDCPNGVFNNYIVKFRGVHCYCPPDCIRPLRNSQDAKIRRDTIIL